MDKYPDAKSPVQFFKEQEHNLSQTVNKLPRKLAQIPMGSEDRWLPSAEGELPQLGAVSSQLTVPVFPVPTSDWLAPSVGERIGAQVNAYSRYRYLGTYPFRPFSPPWDRDSRDHSTAQGAAQGPVNQRDKEVGPNQKIPVYGWVTFWSLGEPWGAF